MSFLSKINFPKDLKKLTLDELKILNDELRTFTIETVSKTKATFFQSQKQYQYDINSFSLTMPRGQTRWKLELVIYIIAKVPRGKTCRRLRLLNTLCKNTQRPDSLEAGPC